MQIEAEIESMAFGGHGIIKKDGLVIFVPFTAPQDRVVVEITKSKKRHSFAKLISIVKPSPIRLKAPCEYFGYCGGCQLQHMTYESQLFWKKRFIEDALNRIGGIDCQVLPTIAATSIWSYRRHITLSLQPKNGGYEACFYTAEDNALFPPNKCLLFETPDETLLSSIQLFLNDLDNKDNKSGIIKLLRNDSGKLILIFHFPSCLPSNYQQLTQKILSSGICEGGIWKSPKAHEIFGVINTQFQIDGVDFVYSPLGFVQNHPEQSIQIYQKLSELIDDPNEKVLDLYCGIGISSLLLAKKGIQVIGIDQSEETINAATINQKKNNIENVKFVNAPAEKAIDEFYEKLGATIAIVNPPRIGLSTLVLETLINKRPKEIFYISCQPATLARDIRKLLDKNYQIKFCQPYDMFPQTTHVEAMLQLTRS